ncbi:MAG: AAA family ATPase [Candidatus Rokubacteria bacterium]|nr:AAA family ATPase [Candidatus Rokubacteria bacterium]
MYEAYWGLSRAPFQNVPDPAFFCPLPVHLEVLGRLPYVVDHGKGAALLTGEVGCGKSTLGRVFLSQLDASKYDVGLVINPALAGRDLLHEIALQLGLSRPSPHRSVLLRALADHLLANAERGAATVLIVDEAQTIADEAVFEDLRMLLNFQLNDRYLLSLILLGLPELRTRLARLPSLNQRIAFRLNLSFLNPEETAFYITFRLKKAGATAPIFTDQAMDLVYRETGGIPRSINNLCDLCLYDGWKRRAEAVDASVVEAALAFV